jgi:type I restriction enzyme R subunit
MQNVRGDSLASRTAQTHTHGRSEPFVLHLVRRRSPSRQQQFATSPDLNTELLNAIMGALDAHNAMSTRTLNSREVQQGLKEILLNHSELYERLRSVESSRT